MRRVVEVETGSGKSGRRAYGFDDIANCSQPPHARSRMSTSPGDLDCVLNSSFPMMAAAMDGVVSRPPSRRGSDGLGGLACLNPKGLDPYEDPTGLRGDRDALFLF